MVGGRDGCRIGLVNTALSIAATMEAHRLFPGAFGFSSTIDPKGKKNKQTNDDQHD